MPTENGEQPKLGTKVVTTTATGGAQGHGPEPENLPCPRCESTNTKFCYYNNYNLSQPRYFCKACRRYWTRGGTLRNVPVGGGSRKNSKRSRSSSSSTSSSVTSAPTAGTPNSTSFALNSQGMQYEGHQVVGVKTEMPLCDVDLNLNEASFTSLLTCNTAGVTQPGGGGYVANVGITHQHGFGVGLGLGFGPSAVFEDIGFGLGFGQASMVEGNQNNVGGNTWQLGGGEGGGEGMDGGDCFGWPELAISTAGKGLE